MPGHNIVELIMKLKDELSGPLGRFEAKFKRLSNAIKNGALVIGGAIVGLVGNSIRLAASFEEMEAKFEAVFKEYAPAARAELKLLADELGRSSNKWIGYAATIQDTLVPLGWAREDASKLSVELVALGADLSSFSDIPMEQVMMDIQTAVVGNTEVLRKYGVVAQELQIKQYALEQGLWDGVGAMEAQAKGAAILGLIYAGTADAQGDAARTADSFTNTMRQASDQLHDYQIELGQKLLPIIADLVSTHMPNFIDSLENIVPPLVTFVTNVANLADGLISIINASKQADEAVILFEGNLGNLGNMLTGQVADGIYTAEEALEIWNNEVETMGKTLPFNELYEFMEANHLSSTAIIEQSVAVQIFRDELVQLTLVQLENLRVLMHSMSILPGFSQVTQAAFEQLNAEVTQRLVPSIISLGSAAGSALSDLKSLFREASTGVPEVTAPGTIGEEEVSRQIARREVIKEAAIANMEEVAREEEAAIARRTEAELLSIQAGKKRAIAARAEIREIEDVNDARRREVLQNVADIGVAGARDIGQEMIRGVEGWEERALQAIALMVIKAAAVSIGGPIGGILGFVGGLFQSGGGILHAQGGRKIPDTGPYGDRHLVAVERGEVIFNQQQVLQGMLPGSSRNVSVVVYHQPLVSSASAGEMVTLGHVVIEAIEKAGGNVG